MNKFSSLFAVMAIALTPVAAQSADKAGGTDAPVASRGKMLYSSDGVKIASVNRVTTDGSAQLIVSGRLVTIPASSISVENGKLATKMTRKEVMAIR